MKDTKLVRMLMKFEDSELKELEYFVKSPYFSRGRDVKPLFNALKMFYPAFDDEKLLPENIFSILYPGRRYGKAAAGLLYTLSSELYKLCREFLIITELNKDICRKQYYLLNRLREKQLYKEFEREYRINSFPEDDLKKGGADYFINKYFLQLSYSEYCVETGDAGNAFENILTLGDHMAMVALMLGYRNPDLKESANIYNLEVRHTLVDKLIDSIDSASLLESMKNSGDEYYPYVYVNHLIYKMSVDFSDEDYCRLKEFIVNNLTLFGHTEKYVMHGILVSYCVRKYENEDDPFWRKEHFEINKAVCRLGLLTYDDKSMIQVSNFRNMIKSAFDQGEFDWLENFVKDHINKLQPDYIDNMSCYSYAYIHAGRKEFGKALENLVKVKNDFFLFKLDIKNLMVRMYYELDYTEQAYSMLDALRHYISGTADLTQRYKIKEENFVRYFSRLLKLKFLGNEEDIHILTKDLKSEKNVSSKSWLSEKADELIQKYIK